MALVAEASVAWFVRFMALANDGVIPSVTPGDQMPSRADVAIFCGPKYNSGFTFDNHGDAAYDQYVRELYRRVMQLPWPLSNTLPFHFCRGLVAEAQGKDVNWAEFAFKATHHHLNVHAQPRILPEFWGIAEPLPPLPKVIPQPDLSVSETLCHQFKLFMGCLPLNCLSIHVCTYVVL